MTIYTLGYSGWKIEDVEVTLNRLGAILVDVRMVPRSRWAPSWNAAALHARLGDASAGSAQGRYVWLREFGNRNHKGTFDQIEIADFPAGEAKLQTAVASGHTIILLCACRNVNTCHRKILAERLAELWNAAVSHLTPPDKGTGGIKPGLVPTTAPAPVV